MNQPMSLGEEIVSFPKSIKALAVLICAGSFATLVEAQLAPVSDIVNIQIINVEPSAALFFPEPTGDGLTIFTIIGGVSPTGDSSQYGNYTVLTEPDGTISDVFGVVPAIACLACDLGPNVLGVGIAVNFAFFSDTETGGTTVPPEFINPSGGTPIILAEGNGGPFDITKYLSPVLRDAGFFGTFTSDVERAPEPATLTLLTIGLVGLGLSRRGLKSSRNTLGRR